MIWSCWKKQKLWAQSQNCLKSQKRDKILNFFTVDRYTNCLGCPNVSGFLELQKYANYSDCYRLFCFWEILFFTCCLLILMHLWLVRGVWTMEKLEYSRYYTNINKEWVHNSTKSGDLFSYTMELTRFSVEFCVVKFSSFA